VGGAQKAWTTPDYLVYPDTLQKTSSKKTGIVLGVVASVPFSKHFSFRTGVLYSAKGSNQTQHYDTTDLYASTVNLPANQKSKPLSTTTKLNVNYIDIPLNLMYKLSIKGNSSFVVGVGPQLSIFYNGNTFTETVSVSQDSPEENSMKYSFKTSENNDLPIGKVPGKYRVVHFGLNAFIGIEFNRIFLNAAYTTDLNEFYAEEGRKYKNKTAGISLGIFLGQRNANVK
jgi:hypothetical protein